MWGAKGEKPTSLLGNQRGRKQQYQKPGFVDVLDTHYESSTSTPKKPPLSLPPPWEKSPIRPAPRSRSAGSPLPDLPPSSPAQQMRTTPEDFHSDPDDEWRRMRPPRALAGVATYSAKKKTPTPEYWKYAERTGMRTAAYTPTTYRTLRNLPATPVRNVGHESQKRLEFTRFRGSPHEIKKTTTTTGVEGMKKLVDYTPSSEEQTPAANKPTTTTTTQENNIQDAYPTFEGSKRPAQQQQQPRVFGGSSLGNVLGQTASSAIKFLGSTIATRTRIPLRIPQRSIFPIGGGGGPPPPTRRPRPANASWREYTLPAKNRALQRKSSLERYVLPIYLDQRTLLLTKTGMWE